MSNTEAAMKIIGFATRLNYCTDEDCKAIALACGALMEHYDYEEPDEVTDDV